MADSGWLALCLPLTKRFESCELRAYLDRVAKPPVWTVGWGSTGAGIGPDTVWTQDRADGELMSRLSTLYSQINGCVKVPVSDGQMAALCDFAYEEGFGALRTSTLLEKLNTGDYGGASLEFLRWDKAGGVAVEGIERRRIADRALFDEPSTASPQTPADPGHRALLAVLVSALWRLVGRLFGRR